VLLSHCLHLAWALKEKLSATIGILSMDMCSIPKKYRHGRKAYNNGVCVKRSTSSELIGYPF